MRLVVAVAVTVMLAVAGCSSAPAGSPASTPTETLSPVAVPTLAERSAAADHPIVAAHRAQLRGQTVTLTVTRTQSTTDATTTERLAAAFSADRSRVHVHHAVETTGPAMPVERQLWVAGETVERRTAGDDWHEHGAVLSVDAPDGDPPRDPWELARPSLPVVIAAVDETERVTRGPASAMYLVALEPTDRLAADDLTDVGNASLIVTHRHDGLVASYVVRFDAVRDGEAVSVRYAIEYTTGATAVPTPPAPDATRTG